MSVRCLLCSALAATSLGKGFCLCCLEYLRAEEARKAKNENP